jgi:hypothetical protein
VPAATQSDTLVHSMEPISGPALGMALESEGTGAVWDCESSPELASRKEPRHRILTDFRSRQ